MDRTTTTDSLGIVTLAIAAFKRGQLTEDQLHQINNCADDFTRALSLANKYREMTGKNLQLDELPSPLDLRRHLELEDFRAALNEATAVRARLEALFQAAKRHLGDLGLRTA